MHDNDPDRPVLMHVALDAPDARALAEFYRLLLGLRYRDGDPTEGPADWLVLVDDVGRRVLAVQEKPGLPASTWPSEEVPMQLHLDLRVPTREALERHRARAVELGARPLHDRADDVGEPLHVLADPAGHPFCLLVSPG